MKASTKRALSLIVAAGLIVISLFIYATLISPEYSEITRLRGELLSKSNLLEQQRDSITRVQNLIAQYQGVAKLGESLSLALPDNESIPSLMAQINAISQSSGITVQSIGVSYLPIKPSSIKISSAQNIGSLRLELKLFGSYAALKLFLAALETNIRIMDARLLKVESSSSKTSQDFFTYTLSVDTYYQSK